MTTWTDLTTRAAGYVITSTNWNEEVVDNMTVLNNIIGHTNGAHRSITDGGVLLGNGTGAIQAMSVLAKGELIVGDGTTDPQALAAPTDGQYLVGDTGEALGVKWDSPSTLLNPEDVMLYA